jgi:two-component system CheB/CheR fusion protein
MGKRSLCREPRCRLGRASDDAHFSIVGVGASAGGLDAFKKLFGALPADSGLAFVLLQHLDRRAPA